MGLKTAGAREAFVPFVLIPENALYVRHGRFPITEDTVYLNARRSQVWLRDKFSEIYSSDGLGGLRFEKGQRSGGKKASEQRPLDGHLSGSKLLIHRGGKQIASVYITDKVGSLNKVASGRKMGDERRDLIVIEGM